MQRQFKKKPLLFRGEVDSTFKVNSYLAHCPFSAAAPLAQLLDFFEHPSVFLPQDFCLAHSDFSMASPFLQVPQQLSFAQESASAKSLVARITIAASVISFLIGVPPFDLVSIAYRFHHVSQ